LVVEQPAVSVDADAVDLAAVSDGPVDRANGAAVF
jgi:hypothetical protein